MSLIDGLIAYYKLDEASGGAVDSHGSFDLSDNNTVGSDTGKIGNARKYVAANSEYHSRSHDSALTFTDDFTIAFWFHLTSEGFMPLACKSHGNSMNYTFIAAIDIFGSGTPRFGGVFDDGSAFPEVSDALSLDTWYHGVCYRNHTGGKVGIVLNAGTPVEDNEIAPVATTGNFDIGAVSDSGLFADALIDEFGIWDRVLSSQEISALYNGGNGLAYPFAPPVTPAITSRPFTRAFQSPFRSAF